MKLPRVLDSTLIFRRRESRYNIILSFIITELNFHIFMVVDRIFYPKNFLLFAISKSLSLRMSRENGQKRKGFVLSWARQRTLSSTVPQTRKYQWQNENYKKERSDRELWRNLEFSSNSSSRGCKVASSFLVCSGANVRRKLKNRDSSGVKTYSIEWQSFATYVASRMTVNFVARVWLWKVPWRFA